MTLVAQSALCEALHIPQYSEKKKTLHSRADQGSVLTVHMCVRVGSQWVNGDGVGDGFGQGEK